VLNFATATRAARATQAGFMLVEVLVTIVIFTIGLLGVIGLQALAMSSSHMSSMRSSATVLASDMAERMRANLGAVNAAAGTTYDDAVPASNACRAIYAGSVEAAPASCAPAAMAADDLQDWQDLIGQALPAGSGAVCLDSTPDDGLPGAEACDGEALTSCEPPALIDLPSGGASTASRWSNCWSRAGSA